MVTLLYYVTAKLGLLLAIPPGYATAIWPPTGISLFFTLMYGPIMGFGVFLGSFTINFFNNAPSEIPNSLLVPFFIGCGAVINATLSSELIKKLVGFPNAVEEPSDIIKFLLIGGPLGCSISAIIGTTTLAYFKVINLNNYFENCFTWWVGDVIGVIVFTPILILLKQWIHKKMFKKISLITIPLLLAFSVTIFTYIYISRLEQHKLDKSFKEDVDKLAQSIELTLKRQADILNYIKYYFENSTSVTRDEFRGFTEKIILSNPEITALKWAPFINANKISQFKKSLISEGFNDIKLYSNQKNYFPIQFIEPLNSNRLLVGQNLANNDIISNNINEVVETGKDIISHSETNDSTKQITVKIFNPIFKKGTNKFGLNHVQGILISVLHIENTLVNLTFNGIEYIISENVSPNQHIIYSSNGSKNILNHPNLSQNDSENTQRVINVPGKTWILQAVKTSDYTLNNKSWATWFVLAGGLFFTAFIELILLIILGKSNQIEKIVLQKTTDLIEANNEIKKVSLHKSEFLANMSHEIRTPMNGIIGMVDLILSRNKLDSDDQNSFGIIKDCSTSLLTIINDILDYSKVEAGKMVPEKNNFNLHKLVKGVLSLFNQEANNKDIKLILTIAEDVPEGIKTDEVRLKQIINNLMSNALKFTIKGEISVSISVKNKLPNNMYDILFQIKDTGIGISKSSQSKLFTAFTQADSSTTRKYGGTGLGLAICKKLVHLLGGDIELTSTLGKGSQFSFNIIAEKAEITPSDQIENSMIIGADLASSYPLNILVVEDNLVNQKIAIKILGKLGYQPDLASNGLEAIEALQYRKFDLVFMDMQMPIMDGIEATKKIREQFTKDKITIVAMTANVFQEDKEKCLAAGMDDFTSKPINFNKIQSIIIKLFSPVAVNQEGKVS